MGAMEWGRDRLERWASPHTAARARAQARSVLGHFFHGGHGMGRNGRQRTSCSGESGDGASRRTGKESVPGTSSMGAMEWGVRVGAQSPRSCCESHKL